MSLECLHLIDFLEVKFILAGVLALLVAFPLSSHDPRPWLLLVIGFAVDKAGGRELDCGGFSLTNIIFDEENIISVVHSIH